MPRAQQFSDEDKAMRIVCYSICAVCVAILVALLLYTILV
jgi:t-SNARE complex subunit (syntaxin)